ncbi:MAG: hypothetical protein JOZ27_09335, partial [Caulobacteraceae bacterium]|nr:hypothetical protein [Caulobacteraceae bacterium]
MEAAGGIAPTIRNRLRFDASFAALAVALASFPSIALAQGMIAAPPPVRSTVDANGVDLITGALTINTRDLSIGQGEGALTYSRSMIAGGWTDNQIGTISSNGTTLTVSLGNVSESFAYTGGVYVNSQGGGSTLTASGNYYTYTTASGVVITFDKGLAGTWPPYADQGRPTSAVYPDGKVVTYTYQVV